MNIILDTNIYVQNYLLNSRNFELLFDYLKKTNSNILVPRIVFDELLEKYRNSILDQLDALTKTQNRLENILINFNPDNSEIDIELEISKYSKYFLEKLGVEDKDVVEHKTTYLNELISRAIKRRKPFSDKGEEFRDALLWLVMLDITSEIGGVIAFISNDVKAFGQAETLHDELLEEIKQRNIQVNYFSSIKAFIEKQAIQVDFINEDWLINAIDFEQFDKAIEEQLSERLYNPQLNTRWLDDWKNLEFDGYINRTANVDKDNIYAFYVYEKADGNLYIEVTYYIEYEIEFYIEEQRKKDPWLLSSLSDDLNAIIDNVPKYTIKCAEAEIIFGVDVSKGNVINIDLVSTYI